ncbi:hypothetical protein SFRURICE_009582 [Spodoptera frugiperda]|nr:hypothetical protein SFRURICE_009582 [Spodoptera frugiperda]
MVKLGDHGQASRQWPSLPTTAKLGDLCQTWPNYSLANMAKLGEHGQAWRPWPSLSNKAKLVKQGQAWRPWTSLATLEKLGDPGQAWRTWPSLATMTKLGEHGQAWRTWPSLANMAKLVKHGQRYLTLSYALMSYFTLSAIVENFPKPIFLKINDTLRAFLTLCLRKLRVLFYQRYAMRYCCGCVWLPPIIFISTHSLALVETDSAKLLATKCLISKL